MASARSRSTTSTRLTIQPPADKTRGRRRMRLFPFSSIIDNGYRMTQTTTATPAAASDPLTDRVRATWTSGDFGRIAKGYERGAAEFIARLELESGERVLDVACGTGNLTMPAARMEASVTGIDIAANLLAQAKARADAEGWLITLDEGDGTSPS